MNHMRSLVGLNRLGNSYKKRKVLHGFMLKGLLLYRSALSFEKSVAFKSLVENSCEVKSGGQEMVAIMLMLINVPLTSLQPFLGCHL